jgi:uncharacterized damage-inducible protein DinB
MYTIQDFIRLLSIEHNIIHTQTEGLTQADTFIQPQPSGNCMNWVLGHLLENQISMLSILGGESPVDGGFLERYQRDSEPVTGDGPAVLSLATLLTGLDRVESSLLTRLAELNDTDFTREIEFSSRTMTVGWRVMFLNFHFTYHIGQLEILRQMAGRSEKLI